ncbi:MAG: anion permease [Chloroflexales bacterium]|nr:anion permease [Chloroflexales bacterium]
MQKTGSLTAQQAHMPQPVKLKPKEITALVLGALVILAMTFLPLDLSVTGRITLGVWLLALIAWTLTSLSDTFVALIAAIVLVATTTVTSENFFASLGHSVIWLMAGAYILAGGLKASGLAMRVFALAARPAHTVAQLFYLLTAALLVSTLFIPSISVRSALMAPIYVVFASMFQDRAISRALAIMLPINLVLTAVGSVIGDGAHLVINDALGQLLGEPLSFLDWMLMGMPFAAISSFASTWVILHMFLTPERRRRPLIAILPEETARRGRLTFNESYMLGVVLVLLALWLTEPLHGINSALVAFLGAIAVVFPRPGILTVKGAASEVSWDSILFAAAALTLASGLVESGAGRWIVDLFLPHEQTFSTWTQFLIIVSIGAVTLGSHLFIISRSARAALIVPATVLLAYSLNLAPQTVAFITAAGVGYAITLVVSARPLNTFRNLVDSTGQQSFDPPDLLRLSAVLAPLHLVLIIVFATFYWPLFSDPPPAMLSDAQQRIEAAPISTGQLGLLDGSLFFSSAQLDELDLANRATLCECVTPTPAAETAP